jgi:hypothetical protein
MSKKIDPLARLRELHEAAALAIRPNENSRGPWQAKRVIDPECSILAPAYLRRPHRMMLGEISIDGLTEDEARENSSAVAEFIVACVNHVIEQLHPAEFCPECSHPTSEHTTGCTVLHCRCRRSAESIKVP